MTQIMSPSETLVTAAQIGKIQDLLAAGLRKAGLQSKPTQVVIEQQTKSLVDDLVAAVRVRVEAVSKMIIRIVEKVNRTKQPQEVLDATGRKQYTNAEVVKSIPHGTGDGAEVIFFKPESEEYTRPGYISDDDLEKALTRRCLIAADPYSQAAVNEADPAFADKYPNGTHWKDANGKWCYSAFHHWDDERDVNVDRDGYDWIDDWWFAGLRK